MIQEERFVMLAAPVMKVLVVDDNPAVLTALEVLFDVHDIETLAARGPDEALAMVKREDVGVVVQDMKSLADMMV